MNPVIRKGKMCWRTVQGPSSGQIAKRVPVDGARQAVREASRSGETNPTPG